MNNEIIVIAGLSSVGKDSVASLLNIKHNYNFIQSVSSRPMRDGESYGNPYKFVKHSEFESMKSDNKFIEFREYSTIDNGEDSVWGYGVLNEDVVEDNKYVVVLDYDGYKEFREKFGDRVKSIWLTVDESTRRERAENRGSFDEAEWNRRLADDKIRFEGIEFEKEFDYVIENDSLDMTMNKIKNIIGD